MKARAAMLWGPEDTAWSLEDVEIDEPQGAEMLVRNVASGLCHSDEHFITGDMPHGGYPWIAGHEGAGIVEAVGPDVRGVVPGDHVVYSGRDIFFHDDAAGSGQVRDQNPEYAEVVS